MDAEIAIRLLIGLLAFASLMVWQVRTIAAALPGPAGGRGAGVDHSLLPGAVRLHLLRDELAAAASFTQPLPRMDALDFTVTVFSTVGFGDITANPGPPGSCSPSRCSPTSHILGTGLRVLLGAAQRGRERRPDPGHDAWQAAM